MKRVREIKALLKGKSNLRRFEREVALLALDALAGIKAKTLSPKAAGRCFVDIEYALNQDIEKRLRPKFSEMMFEAILLDELGTKYGPDIRLLRRRALALSRK